MVLRDELSGTLSCGVSGISGNQVTSRGLQMSSKQYVPSFRIWPKTRQLPVGLGKLLSGRLFPGTVFPKALILSDCMKK